MLQELKFTLAKDGNKVNAHDLKLMTCSSSTVFTIKLL